MGEYDFMPENQTKTLGNDDQSFWGLAAMTAAEAELTAPNDVGDWIDLAINVFNVQAERWNTDSCDGGLKWQIFSFNNGYNYRNSISNGNFFLLSARLAKFTGNSTYSEWAQKAMDWEQKVGLISDDYAVYDGTSDTTNCSQVNHIQWSMDSAIFAEGAALMYNLVRSLVPFSHLNTQTDYLHRPRVTRSGRLPSLVSSTPARFFKATTQCFLRSHARQETLAIPTS